VTVLVVADSWPVILQWDRLAACQLHRLEAGAWSLYISKVMLGRGLSTYQGIGANIGKIRVRYLLFIHAIYRLANYLKRPFSFKLAPMTYQGETGAFPGAERGVLCQRALWRAFMNADDESPREGGQQLHAALLTDEQKLWRQLSAKPCAASTSPGSASLVLILRGTA
jgi:hypothetical protein